MFRLRALTWVVLIGLGVGGTLLNQALEGGAIGSYTVLIGGLLLTSLTDRDRFYAADLTRESRRTQGSTR
jgi:hypothetical protein